MYATAADSIVVKSPIQHVREGGMLAIHCQVWNLEKDEIITLTRKSGSNSETLSYGDHVQPSVEERVFLAVRRMSGGSMVSFLTIYNVDRHVDEGEYFCKVLSTGDTIREVAKGSVDIQVQYFPLDPNPICSSNQPLEVNAGTLVVLNCTSQAGYPTVRMTWGRTGSNIKLANGQIAITRNGVVFNELRFVATKEHSSAMFLCSMTSPAFPAQTKTCHVGPFLVYGDQSNTYEDINMDKPARTSSYIDRDEKEDDLYVIHENPTVTSISSSTKCKQACTSITKTMRFWVMATIVAATISFIFLVIGVYFALKLCRVSESTKRNAMRPRVPLHQLTEEVYEKLDCKPENSSMMYMTLEKLRKPDHLTVRDHRIEHVEGTYSGTPTAYVP